MCGKIYIRFAGLALAAVLCGNRPAWGQIQAGSETQLNLDGSISAGYAGSMSNEGPDSHGLDLGGIGNFSGSYHSPQFLNFDVTPFFNQSRNNSTFQSITDSSGVTAGVNLFGGSQFPGFINFSKFYNTESNYAVPGLANYATNGNTDAFGVGWSAHFKNLPSLSFGYQQGSSDYSVYGTQQDSFNHYHSVFGNANYTVDGFHLTGGIHYSNADSLFPQIEEGEATEKTNSDSTTYTLGMTRSIPLEGTTWLNYSRNTTDYNTPGMSSSQTSDIVNGGVAVRPASKLTLQVNGDYNDNLAGSIFQSITGSGAIAPIAITEEPSYSWGLTGSAQYSLLTGLYVAGSISHREQLFLGESFDANAVSGSVNYGRNLLGGQFTANATVSRNSYGTNGESMLGLLTNVIYIRRFGAWSVSGSFGYSQNVQSLLIAYTSSGYSYSGSANRRIGRLIWTLTGSGARSLLTEVEGTSYFMQGYSTGLSGRWLGASFGYSKSSGVGLVSPTGIVPLPPGVPPTLVPGIVYGGTTYSASLGSTPKRGLTVNGTYVDSRSNTLNGTLASNNRTEQAYAYMSYQFRKVYFNAGYSRLLQGFTGTGLPESLVSTYYFGVSRWFKVF